MKKLAAKTLLMSVFTALLWGMPAAAQSQSPPVLQHQQTQEPRYQLSPGDVLDIQYRYTPEFNQTITIQPDGYVSLEIGGEVNVSGLTLEQVRKRIYESAVVRLKDPELIIVLKEFQRPYFVVAGEVVQPGKFEMREYVTAMQSILLAGGFKESAKSSQVLIYRKINADTAEVKVLNLRKIKKTNDLENDLKLEAGDIVMVPRNTLSRIERYIKLASVAAFLNPLLR